MSENLNLSMFRAYDIRTPAVRLTPELARRLADAEAVYFREALNTGSVVVAHDARRTGPAYLTVAVQAYQDAGLGSSIYPASVRHRISTTQRCDTLNPQR